MSEEKKTKVTADVSYIVGHLRYGHYEMFLTDKELEEFKAGTDEDKRDFFSDLGELIVDDYEIDDYDTPSNIKIHE